jgi:hypothetical protein
MVRGNNDLQWKNRKSATASALPWLQRCRAERQLRRVKKTH